MLWLQIKFKINLKTKLNVQKGSIILEGIKGNERVKWKEYLNIKDD